MSDEALQALRRRFEQSGAVEDEAAWLAAALRAGELPRERVALRAHLGDRAARLALGLEGPVEADLAAWVRGLAEFGQEEETRAPSVPSRGWGNPVLVRACLAALERIGPSELIAPGPGWTPETAREDLVADLRAWLADRAQEPRPWVSAATYAYESRAQDRAEEARCLISALTAAQACTTQDAAILAMRLLSLWLTLNRSVAYRQVHTPGQLAAVAVCAAASVTGEREARAAVREALVAWP
ncbi:MAG: hypothetical protein AB7N76_22685 [Planctomycetota bacterium]